MTEVRWERMFIDQLEDAFARCPLAYFTYGLCEPHGPQCAVGLDALKAHAIACLAAQRHGGIVAPPDYWHIHELGGYALWAQRYVGEVPRTWLTAVPPWVHFKNVCYQIRAADALGFHAAILLTGHYGPNWQDLKTLVELIQPHCGVRLYALPDFECNQPGFDGDGASGDHAGKVETSLLWAVEPGCVDVSRIPAEGTPGEHYAMGNNAREANRRTGERMAQDEADWLGAKGKALLTEYEHASPAARLRTFEQVEQMWDELVRPRLHSFASMQDSWDSPAQQVPAESTWYANWRVPPRS
ncbi:MAG: creatininase family protein [Chloroflexi bacterium]|nr:creatininase family protein [Chloroflexota bacterium]